MKFGGALVGLLLVTGVAAGCNQAPSEVAPPPAAPAIPPTPPTPVATTAEVLASHQKAFSAGDLEGVLADYAPDATMFFLGETARGHAALRKTFQMILDEWGGPGTKFTMKSQIVEGPYAYTFWEAETSSNKYEGASDAFVVQDGKIVAHFFSGKVTPK